MTNRWLTGIAVAALTAAGTMAAQAADLPTRKEAPAPVFVPPPFTWTGFYVGLNAGAVWSMGSRTTSLSMPAMSANFLGTYYPGNLGNSNTGVYRRRSGRLQLADRGVRARRRNRLRRDDPGQDLQLYQPPALRAGTTAFPGDILYVNAKANLDWLGTTRARLGFVATPDNRLMFYATGGVAYGGGSSNFSAYDAQNNIFLTGSPSSSRVGWTIGGGVEYAITNNITIKGEYLYYDLGSTTFTSPVPAAFASLSRASVATTKYTYDGSIVRAGVNYKF